MWYGGLVDGMRDASGQMYMRNRYYDPATGQFTQTDPIGIAGGLNVYGFAAGDPVTYSDPYGLCPQCIGAAHALLDIPNGNTQDPVLDNPSTRMPMEAGYDNAPRDADGYALEQGAACNRNGTCTAGRNPTRESIQLPVNQNTAYDWHTHGNVGRPRQSGVAGDVYTRGPSDTDINESVAYLPFGILPTSYIIDDKYIYKLTPAADGSVTQTTYQRYLIPRAPDNP